MIQIDDPPDRAGCSGCMQPLVWLWSPRRHAWVAFVAGPDPLSLLVHGCRTGQDIPTWRQTHRGDPPTSEYLAVKERLKTSPKGTT